MATCLSVPSSLASGLSSDDSLSLGGGGMVACGPKDGDRSPPSTLEATP